MFDTDVFVLGGGPAGLAAAVAARLQGFRVMLTDAERPPIDKACGEGLMPDSVTAAARLGIHVRPEMGYAFRGISFRGEKHCVASDFPNGIGIGLRRPVLQRLLVERCEELGVQMIWGTRVTGIQGHAIRLGSSEVRSRWIVGADGAQSLVRRWAGLQRFARNSERFSYRRHYQITPWSEYMEIWWGRRCQFYVTPVSSSEVCLVLMSQQPQQRISDTLPEFPVLQHRLEGCPTTTPERGAIAATRKLHRVAKGPVALVGDASGTVDPIAGEGMCLAFKQAIALAQAMTEGELSVYESAHREIALRPRFMSDFMLLMDKSSMLQKRTMKCFQGSPHLFSNLIAMHVGQLAPARFLATVATLGWRVATA